MQKIEFLTACIKIYNMWVLLWIYIQGIKYVASTTVLEVRHRFEVTKVGSLVELLSF